MRKVVLITGSGAGIGKEIATLLAQKQYNLILTDCAEENICQLANQINAGGGCAKYKILDIKNSTHFKAALDFSVSEFGKLDVWINNAGIMPTGHFLEMPESQVREILNINFLGAVTGMQTVLPYFFKQNAGHVINIASITAKVPLPYASVYSASKSALVTLCDGLRIEYAGKGVYISCLLPGTVNTGLIKNIKPPIIPRVLDSKQVAKAIFALIEKPKNNVFLPWYLKPMSLVHQILPQFMIEFIGRALRINESAKPN